MAKKGKQVLWHKKQGKIVPAKYLNVHGKKTDSPGETPKTGDRIKDFARSLTAQIKKAAREQRL